MKRLKRMGLRRLGGRRGFTLIELLIVMVILAILAGIVIISVGGVIGRGQQTAYNADSENVQTAVLAYFAEKAEWPIYDPTDDVTIGAVAYDAIDMCAMVGAELYLIEVPRSACSGVAGDNCAGACTCSGSYVWVVDTAAGGTVYSCCEGTACADTCGAAASWADADGFQDVFP